MENPHTSFDFAAEMGFTQRFGASWSRMHICSSTMPRNLGLW